MPFREDIASKLVDLDACGPLTCGPGEVSAHHVFSVCLRGTRVLVERLQQQCLSTGRLCTQVVELALHTGRWLGSGKMPDRCCDWSISAEAPVQRVLKLVHRGGGFCRCAAEATLHSAVIQSRQWKAATETTLHKQQTTDGYLASVLWKCYTSYCITEEQHGIFLDLHDHSRVDAHRSCTCRCHTLSLCSSRRHCHSWPRRWHSLHVADCVITCLFDDRRT